VTGWHAGRGMNAHSFGWLLAGDDLGAPVCGGLVIAFVVSDHDVKASGFKRPVVSEINSVGYSEAVRAADRRTSWQTMGP
jgi:hypothetical protein